jgi:hypothetical protein
MRKAQSRVNRMHKTIGQKLDEVASRTTMRRLTTALTLVGVGLISGLLIPPPGAVLGEVKEQPPAQAFQSGDQLALPILRDVANTLHQIDGRLSRLETVFKELTTPRPKAVTGN